MDEQSVDDFIKGKLDQYEDPTFDESALSDFKERLSSFQPPPWYVQHRGKLTALAAALLFTMLNGYILSIGILSDNQEKAELAAIENEKIDSLTSIIHQLIHVQEITSAKVDSLSRLYRTMGERYEHRISLWSAEKSNWQETMAMEKERIHHEWLAVLARENKVSMEDNPWGSADSYHSRGRYASAFHLSDVEKMHIHLNDHFFQLLNGSTLHASRRPDHAVSAKTRAALEKHYFSGLGINVGPHADLIQNFIPATKGGISPRIGVSADWIVSPRLSVETSFDYSTVKYLVKHGFENFGLPDYNQNLGELSGASVTSQLLSLPVSLKYRQWLTHRDQFYVKGGYTPYYSIGSRYEMKYRRSDQGNYDTDDVGTINQVEKNELRKFYGSTLSLGAGVTRNIRKSDKIELGLFYERSLGSLGIDRIHLQLTGIRAAYWFKVKK